MHAPNTNNGNNILTATPIIIPFEIYFLPIFLNFLIINILNQMSNIIPGIIIKKMNVSLLFEENILSIIITINCIMLPKIELTNGAPKKPITRSIHFLALSSL